MMLTILNKRIGIELNFLSYKNCQISSVLPNLTKSQLKIINKEMDDTSNTKTVKFNHKHENDGNDGDNDRYERERKDKRKLSNKFTLSLQYAARQSVALQSNQGKVYWNNVLIASLAPADYNIHTFTQIVNVKVGTNTLRIQGAGTSESYGLGIDNVKLIRVGTNKDIVINGGFERPPQNGAWSIHAGIEGWTSAQIQIGAGTIYNSQWPSQICELDGNHNDVISQSFNFNHRYELAHSC